MAERYAQAIRLASTLKLSRDEWLRIRQLGIGSSDAAPAIGLSPYKCPLSLWLEKTGRKEPEDLSEKELSSGARFWNPSWPGCMPSGPVARYGG
jgi:predicted phage-related endonuclease